MMNIHIVYLVNHLCSYNTALSQINDDVDVMCSQSVWLKIIDTDFSVVELKEACNEKGKRESLNEKTSWERSWNIYYTVGF